MIKRILSFFQSYLKYAIFGPLCMLVEVLCEMIIPRVMALIVDVGITNGDFNYIVNTGLVMAALAVVAVLAGVATMYFSTKASQGLGSNLRKALFDKIQMFSFADVDRFSTASLVTRTTSDVNQIQMSVMMGLRLLVRSTLMMASSIVMSLSINPQLTLVIVVALPLLFLGVIIIMRFVNPLFRLTQKKLDAVSKVVQENVMGIRTVKAFVREKHQAKQFSVANDDYMQNSIKATSLAVLIMPLMMVILNATIVVILWNGGRMVSVGTMGTGELMSFIGYITHILISLMMLSMVFMMLSRAKASSERVLEVLDTEISIKDTLPEKDGEKTQPLIVNGEVVFDQVDFRYEKASGENTLRNISFRAQSGSVVAIVGSTGSGKSSMVSLIPRLYDVTKGCVRVGGNDVREYRQEALRDAIGVVLQKNVLFSGTIRENILWGKPDASEEEIIAAAKAAQAHDFISAFPKGYDTWIEQGGSNVSGGQRQRLCIARAMIKKPKILILDDSTSAVDTATETCIRRSFYEELGDTTVFIVAQRISSVREADQIIVLDDGKISGIGTHDELLVTNKIYQEINESQNSMAEVS